ncbi:RagB/SusD family nutrient uptake outer membrane protein [Sphingobacteriaceae bacterium WQ 2009]|uniref:RagB/SusD family nutrient uptake outer membrane protein n=1 Tax=Rhinopithecimicrobium faecis TaxID=2820698 RepID=A0A8T4H9B8_9SPHI|nr:RagB/SusD family nutrient uptake outer membrane protein [Sphingobacteriaceae bacterium WQ 2009]
MKTNISRNTYAALLLAVLTSLGFQACNKKLDVPSSYVASETLQWESITDTRSALIGVYGLTRAALANNNAHWIYGEMRYGDFVSYNRGDLDAVYNSDLNASFPLIKSLTDWRRFYAVINAASLLIERAPDVLAKDKRYTEINMKYDIAQARTLRAFAYFYMVRIWGDVPLLTKSFDDGQFIERPRTDQAAVLAFAESELVKAAQDLPFGYAEYPQTYYGEEYSRWRAVLFTKLSAYSILAHIAAWQGKYVDTDVYAKYVLDNYPKSALVYSSTSNLTSATGIFSTEQERSQLAAFTFTYKLGEATSSGHIESLTLASPLVSRKMPDIYVPKDSISKIFPDPNDTRFGVDTISGLTRTNYFTNYAGEIPIFSKIKVIRDGVSDGSYAIFGSNLIFTRLEEITLLRAEALAALGMRDDSMRLLNIIRANRGISLYNQTSTQHIIDAIFEERRRELMGEGWRWYDQIRYNKIRQEDPMFNKLIKDQGILWPISSEVLKKNSLLVQNTYWK